MGTEIATNIAKKVTDEPTTLLPAVVDNLCKDYAACCRVNLSEGQVQVIDTLAGIEQQLTEFNQLMEMVGSDRTVISAKTMPAIQAQYEALLPAFDNIDRLEVLVRRVQKDMDEIEKQLEAAEATVDNNPLKNVLKIPFIFGRHTGMVVGNGGSGSSSNESTENAMDFQAVDIFNTSDYFMKSEYGSQNKEEHG